MAPRGFAGRQEDGMDALFQDGVDRRVFVRGLGFVGLGLVMGMMGGCESWLKQIANRPTRRRLRTGSAAVDADIATYRAAVQMMKALPASDPRSWTNQAAIHGTAAGFNFCEHGTVHFFDWHRAFVYSFERICQKLTGNSKFGLPYWNWNQNPAIHSAFLDTSSTLFLARDRNSMSGSPDITTALLDPILADTNFFTFSDQIEGTPHNNVHTFIGGTLGGFSSALDPLFWMHHNMIDYCWAKWNIDLGNNNTNDPSWTNHVNGHLVDGDGDPITFTAAITTILPLLSYQFESSAIGSSPAMAAIKSKEEFKKIEKRIREGAPVRFDIKQRVPIAERATMSIARPLSLRTRPVARNFAAIVEDRAQERIFVSIEYAQLPPRSDFVVRVFLNLPEANRNTPISDPHFAGSFTFFGTEPPANATGQAEHRHHKPRFLVNATDALQRLRKNQQLADDTEITVHLVPVPFEGESQPEDARLVIDQLQLIVTPVILNAGPRE
jgi:tyrosinase